MPAPITIALLPPQGGLARLTFSGTGAATGAIKLVSWSAGHDPTGRSDAELDASVYDITASPDCSELRCKTDHQVFLFTVTMTLDINLDTVEPPSLTLAYTPDPMNAGATRYGVSAEDVKRMKVFLQSAAFPAL